MSMVLWLPTLNSTVSKPIWLMTTVAFSGMFNENCPLASVLVATFDPFTWTEALATAESPAVTRPFRERWPKANDESNRQKTNRNCFKITDAYTFIRKQISLL